MNEWTFIARRVWMVENKRFTIFLPIHMWWWRNKHSSAANWTENEVDSRKRLWDTVGIRGGEATENGQKYDYYIFQRPIHFNPLSNNETV